MAHGTVSAIDSEKVSAQSGVVGHKVGWRVIHIKKGMSLNQVAKEMQQLGLIKSIWRFKLLAWWKRASIRIRSGEYELRVGSSPSKILNTLVNGNIRLHKITFPEGYNLFEIAEVLAKGGFLDKKRFIDLSHNKRWIKGLNIGKVDSLEGYLFPDTYYISRPHSSGSSYSSDGAAFFYLYIVG